ncbi:hypothetical protein TRICI_005712 [Trichomonascus ciferrii]|uniref:Uncharacterized protein n=1 Tax=Trichomonascus ciferrii TaxID=44093 RepID=A0A642UUQ9_9ASCO|nr:hypothetical protein TRICI_005712 [Trichomonascus ciferrii]
MPQQTATTKQGLTDIFNQIDGGKEGGTVVKRVEGIEMVFKYRKNAPNGFLKADAGQISRMAEQFGSNPKQYPRQGCSTASWKSISNFDYSFSINSDDHTFTSQSPACAGKI